MRPGFLTLATCGTACAALVWNPGAQAADAAASAAASAPASPRGSSWAFKVTLDGKPIGDHTFTLTDGDPRELKNVARFDVKVLGFNAYRYRLDATEHWQGDCLRDLSSKTDDDGKVLSVQARKSGDTLLVKSTSGEQTMPGCAMTFAYWNPAMLRQSALLDPSSGRIEKVKIETLDDGSIEVRGKPVAARHYRITGPEQPIDLWYSMQGDWIGLDSLVSGGKRKLSYRLE